MKNKIITIVLCMGLLSVSIAIPLVGMITVFNMGLVGIFNKIGFKNKKSKLFGVTHENNIEQKIGLNLLYGPFIKDKSLYFRKEMINLFTDLERGTTYETVSQAIVLRSLKTMEKNGFITELEYFETEGKKSILNYMNHFFINIGMGNYSKPFKLSKKYDISFRMGAKNLDDNFINSYLNNRTYISDINNTSKKDLVQEKKEEYSLDEYDYEQEDNLYKSSGRGR